MVLRSNKRKSWILLELETPTFEELMDKAICRGDMSIKSLESIKRGYT